MTEVQRCVEAAIEAAWKAVGYRLNYKLMAEAIEAAAPHMVEASAAARRQLAKEKMWTHKPSD